MDGAGQASEREVPFRAADGLERVAVVTPPPGETTGVPGVLLLHGLAKPTPVQGPKVVSTLAGEVARRGVCVVRYVPRVTVVVPRRAAEVDFEAELCDAQGAWEVLAAERCVDPGRLFLLGMSLGGVAAPVVAGRVGGVAGIASWGATARRWAEYARDNLEIQLGFAGRPSGQIRRLAALSDGWHRRLAETELSAREILAEAPGLAGIGVSGSGHYERSAAFWRQVVRLDPGETYRGLSCRVLAVRGEADCSAHAEDLDSVVEAATRAGLEAESVVLEGIDHWLLESRGPRESFRREVGDEPRCDRLAEVVAEWIGGCG